jgi:3-deoxy-manno-octulosonate cytidylyltransferase (CMP-KDO synthetase)
MSVLAVIPARLGATRLPRKPLRHLGGEPLILRVHQRVRTMSGLHEVVVATESEEVATVCRRHGIPVAMTRESHPSGTDRVAEVAAMAAFAHHDIIVNVQGDEPFMPADAVEGAVEVVRSGRAPIGTAAAPAPVDILHHPAVVKVVCDASDRALYFSRAPIPWLRDEADRPDLGPLVRQHLGVYAFTREALAQWIGWPPHPLERVERLEQLRPMAHGLAIGVATAAVAEGGIDTEDDLARANARWDAMTLSGKFV